MKNNANINMLQPHKNNGYIHELITDYLQFLTQIKGTNMQKG